MNGHIARNYLRSQRKKLNLTQKELAFVLGYDSSWRISALENGRARPSAREIAIFTRLFGEPLDQLWPRWAQDIEIDLDNKIRKLMDLLQQSQFGSDRRKRRIEFVLTRLESFLEELPRE